MGFLDPALPCVELAVIINLVQVGLLSFITLLKDSFIGAINLVNCFSRRVVNIDLLSCLLYVHSVDVYEFQEERSATVGHNLVLLAHLDEL